MFTLRFKGSACPSAGSQQSDAVYDSGLGRGPSLASRRTLTSRPSEHHPPAPSPSNIGSREAVHPRVHERVREASDPGLGNLWQSVMGATCCASTEASRRRTGPFRHRAGTCGASSRARPSCVTAPRSSFRRGPVDGVRAAHCRRQRADSLRGGCRGADIDRGAAEGEGGVSWQWRRLRHMLARHSLRAIALLIPVLTYGEGPAPQLLQAAFAACGEKDTQSAMNQCASEVMKKLQDEMAAVIGGYRKRLDKAEKSPLPLPPTYRVPWADLLQKVFAVDVLACPDCGGRLKLIAFVADASVAGRILDHLGLDSRGPPLARAQAPPELLDPGPAYDYADPPYAD